ncbi:hypothetical protein GCM10019059_32310 [Camelimonas fluminis]|uniref:DUF2213 domain-containing protein n=1 Tax=Camelimonas fluminis TaxID=1576911 RepID=A0ABV7UI76_9HYPH|nr:DUF2213 domain-containing protein [Camelimonas fluminis]GHE70060.1 hypothetical protein GCM10019059_32310 [Camelimonas fluminis]
MKMTTDRAPATLVAEQIGASQHLTPEGFLLCRGVRIARTGPMLYAPDEMPEIEPGDRGMVTIERDANVLFSPEAIASFAGKPVTNDHPDEYVTPETWRACAVGVTLDPRRGEGVEAEYLLADLLITDAQAINDVRDGKREVSCGYESEREQIRPGYGRQITVVGNHVALVDRGRCGPSCSIQDGETPMAKRTVWDRMRTAFKAKDEAAFEEELKEAMDQDGYEPQRLVIEVKQPEGEPPPKETGDSDDPLEKLTGAVNDLAGKFTDFEGRLAKLEEGGSKTADEDPEGEGEGDGDEGEDRPSETKDSAKLRDEFADTISRAEILSPGIKLPVFDAKRTRKMTVDAMCALRRKALKNALADEARKPHVAAVLGQAPDIAKMTCDEARIAFRAASELARNANNGPGARHPVGDIPQGPMTAARMQQMIADRRKAARA